MGLLGLSRMCGHYLLPAKKQVCAVDTCYLPKKHGCVVDTCHLPKMQGCVWSLPVIHLKSKDMRSLPVTQQKARICGHCLLPATKQGCAVTACYPPNSQLTSRQVTMQHYHVAIPRCAFRPTLHNQPQIYIA